MRSLKILLLAVGLMLSINPAASAHAELVKSFPVANAKLTKSPKFVQLEFAEAIVTLKSKNANSIAVLDSKAQKIKTSKIVIKKGVARVNVFGTLKPGKYTVKYRIVSADGHVLDANFKFTLS
jgi:methionine-rich copper-binding protein CopC